MNIWKTIRGATSGLAMAVVLGQGAAADGYSVERLVPGSDFHGVHGLAVDPDGALFAGSVNGMSVYRVNRETGEVSTEIPAPDGMGRRHCHRPGWDDGMDGFPDWRHFRPCAGR